MKTERAMPPLAPFPSWQQAELVQIELGYLTFVCLIKKNGYFEE